MRFERERGGWEVEECRKLSGLPTEEGRFDRRTEDATEGTKLEILRPQNVNLNLSSSMKMHRCLFVLWLFCEAQVAMNLTAAEGYPHSLNAFEPTNSRQS